MLGSQVSHEREAAKRENVGNKHEHAFIVLNKYLDPARKNLGQPKLVRRLSAAPLRS
jgi:hypothetical protein